MKTLLSNNSKKLLNSKDVTPYGFDPIEYIDGDKELNPYFPGSKYQFL